MKIENKLKELMDNLAGSNIEGSNKMGWCIETQADCADDREQSCEEFSAEGNERREAALERNARRVYDAD